GFENLSALSVFMALDSANGVIQTFVRRCTQTIQRKSACICAYVHTKSGSTGSHVVQRQTLWHFQTN
ncbi:MAG: hypothetical protein KDE46_20455, partial [Caldilineaceae bacterium]|nr:hypothetical protein [Caldilineaceae bacterium]